MSNPSKSLFLLVVCLAVLPCGLLAQAGPGGGGGAGGGSSRSSSPDGQSAVRAFSPVVVAKESARQIFTLAAGRLRPQMQATHSVPVAGVVTAVNVRPGQAVKQGQELFVLQREDAGSSFAPVVIRSRIDGVVSQVNASIYLEMRAGDSGATVVAADKLLLEVQISDRDARYISAGIPVQAELYTGEVLEGVTSGMGPVPDYLTGLYLLQCTFDSGAEFLGQFVTLRLPVAELHGFFVPNSLLVRRYGKYFLWLANEKNQLELREVVPGRRVDQEIQILEGLIEGDRYVRAITGREKEGEVVPGLEMKE